MAIETLYSREMAEWYDLLYCDKQETELHIQFLTKLFKKHRVRSVLDIACGTGRHAIGLKKRGYEVVGVDLGPAMIEYAAKRAGESGLDIPFYVQDMRDIRLKKKFDAAIIMYTSFAYLASNDDVLKALKSIRGRIRKGGLLVIDTFFVWPKLAEKRLKSKLVTKVGKGDMEYEIIDENRLDPTYNYLYTKATHKRKVGGKNLKVVRDEKPTKLRTFIPNEMDLLFRLSGFKTSAFYGDFKGNELSSKHNRRLIAVAIRK